MNDLISRENTIREIVKRSATDFMDVEVIATVIHVVNQMPSARPKSKWWFSEGEWQCMNCGSELELEDITPFCPHCGADMR